tara:strand:+ start:11453 stop:12019 length:567 start_codon:yes stop_codon:yes gene_type:complete
MAIANIRDNMMATIGNLADVKDPQDVYSGMARDDYDNYISDFRGFEEQLLKARNDTSLIDRAREDSQTQERISKEVQSRNIDRYGGGGLSNAQRQQQQKGLQRNSALSTAGSINNARLAQREVNQATLSDLINIGQGVNRNALGQMNQAAQMQSDRYNAYKNAKSQHSAQMIGMGGQVGSALLAAFLI